MPTTTKKRSRVDLQERDFDIFEAIYDLRFDKKSRDFNRATQQQRKHKVSLPQNGKDY